MVEEEASCVQEEQTDAVCRVCGRTLWRGPARDAVQKKKRPEDPGPRHRTPRSDNENMVKCGK